MKENIPYQPFDKFVLRTPLKPIEYLQKFVSNKETDIELLKIELQGPVIKEAIFLASPDLYSQITEWLEGKEMKQKDLNRLLYSVLKYLSRLSTRCTPFGLFAGISVGEISEATKIEIPDISKYKRNLRLDMNFTVALAMHLSEIPEIREQLKFYPNTSKYITGDQLRYVEYKYQNAKRMHHIAAVDNSEYLQKVLISAQPGAYLKELAELLVDDEISFEEANEFINELISNQILISELEPSVSGDGLLLQIIEVIDKLKGIDEIKSGLYNIKNEIEEINSLPLGINIDRYFGLVEKIKKLEVEFHLKFLFQVDMAKPSTKNKVTNETIDNIVMALNFFNKISLKPQETNLSKFKEKFYERYEEAEMPLLKVLDTETGIGYLNYNSGAGIPSPLIDDISLPGRQDNSFNIRWNTYNSFILKKYIEAIKNKESEILITDAEIEKINSNPGWDDLPDTIYSMVKFYSNNGEAQIFISNAGGSSAINLLGRFADCDQQVKEFIREIADYEEKNNPDKILAEIVHLPESRTGNVLLRPIIRKYEIPYLAKSNVKEEFQVLPEDIMVSVRRNQIVLRSKKLNKQIIPHLSNAHNFSHNALPVYQFLCDMQINDMRRGIGFNWGALQNEFDFLPRVKYKNIILSFAEWKVNKSEIEHLITIKNDEKLLEKVLEWRKKIKLPSWVSLIESDNKLTLNLENLLCIKTLLSLVKGRANFRLSEFYMNNENAYIDYQNDKYANEFIFAFKKVKV